MPSYYLKTVKGGFGVDDDRRAELLRELAEYGYVTARLVGTVIDMELMMCAAGKIHAFQPSQRRAAVAQAGALIEKVRAMRA